MEQDRVSCKSESEADQRILLVDDNPTNLQILAQALEGQGFDLLIARTGEEAVEIAARAQPALVLLDINMPGMGGFETCKRLKSDPVTEHMVVIFLSARQDTHDKLQGFELGAADYISKPFNVKEVVARVHRHLQTYHRQRRLEHKARELESQTGTRFRDLDGGQLEAMIRAGESDRFELKSTLRWNLKANKPGREIEEAWLKTVVAFLNTDGGVLLVGVEDDGHVLGIEPDQFPNDDRYLLHVNNLIRERVGTELAPFISFALKSLHGHPVLCIQCIAAHSPAFLKTGHDEAFYIRMGPGSRKLSTSEVLAYLRNRQEQSRESMPQGSPGHPRPVPEVSPSDPMTPMRVLLVDDNTDNLNVLSQTLEGEGFELLVARSGEEALHVAKTTKPSLILLDIMMPPGMDGYETCQRLKTDPDTRDTAVVFMSALDAVADKVHGFEVGGVDYIAKPFQAEEVRARVRTQLGLIQARTALQAAHDRMKRDLEAAAKIQNKLLPHELPESATVSMTWKYRPCDELAGDFLNVFRVNEREIAVYIADVMGHGVPAALFAFSVSLHLSPFTGPNSILLDASTSTGAAAPAVVLSRLSRRFPLVTQEGRYFTLLYGLLDTETHSFRCANAGHPRPLLVTPEQHIREIDISGNPIGLLERPEFGETTVQLNPGDRIYLYSDGLEEAQNPSGQSFGLERIAETIKTNASQSLETSVDCLVQSVLHWHESDHLSDDASLIGLEIMDAETKDKPLPSRH